MDQHIQVLDCTLRDGCYINGSMFGNIAIRGIIKKLQEAKIDIIECGWLKDSDFIEGSTYYNIPDDVVRYIDDKDNSYLYVAMIDYNRYDVTKLPKCSGEGIDAIRVVFPRGKVREGMELADKIRNKGYKIFYQAANTLGYSDRDLLDLIDGMNEIRPEALSIVDTFGAMYPDDLSRIVSIFLNNLDENIKIGFHSHNNQQLSFSLSMQFADLMREAGRDCIIDSSLCGMGRGAGNTTTELLVSFLNKKYYGNYDMDAIMDAIDIYMVPIMERFRWGYSTPFFIAGLYCCHVNNIDYLLENHRTNAHNMRNIIESLEPSDRLRYDYDLLESKYMENQNRLVDDTETIEYLKSDLADREVLLIAPGKSAAVEKKKIKEYAKEKNAICIAVNALIRDYEYDYLFLQSQVRYEYAQSAYGYIFDSVKKILLSNVKIVPDSNEYIVKYERAIKRGYEHFDNAVICLLRLLNNLQVRRVSIAGFDKLADKYNESYADDQLPTLHGEQDWKKINEDIKKIYSDFRKTTGETMRVRFVTRSYFGCEMDEVITNAGDENV